MNEFQVGLWTPVIAGVVVAATIVLWECLRAKQLKRKPRLFQEVADAKEWSVDEIEVTDEVWNEFILWTERRQRMVVQRSGGIVVDGVIVRKAFRD